MGKFAEVFLGVLTAMGGFVEIGELTFTLNAGTRFQYALLWVSLLGTVGIWSIARWPAASLPSSIRPSSA